MNSISDQGGLVSIAIFHCHEGREQETLDVLRGLYRVLEQKGYSRDLIFRDYSEPCRFYNVRYWQSAQARADAQEDPEVHRHWAALGLLINMEKVQELREVKFE